MGWVKGDELVRVVALVVASVDKTSDTTVVKTKKYIKIF